MDKISVIIPVYNSSSFLKDCYGSLKRQTYSNLEYVFVNDCTLDKSIEILRKVVENYPERKANVRIIDHERNRGLAAARNTALDNATGEFVCHVDSDDWMELDAIEKMVRKQRETGADMISGNMFVHTIYGVEEYHEPNYESKKQCILKQMPASLEHNVIRRIIRRSLYEDNHIRAIEGCNMAEDRYQMVQLCWYANSMSSIDEFVYHYDMNRLASYTKPTSWEQRLRGYMQELRNWVGIREFFSDKSEAFFNETTPYMVDCIKKTMKLALKHHDKKHFQELVNIVHINEDCMRAMGWKTNAMGNLLQSYPVMWVRNSANRAAGYVQCLFKKR